MVVYCSNWHIYRTFPSRLSYLCVREREKKTARLRHHCSLLKAWWAESGPKVRSHRATQPGCNYLSNMCVRESKVQIKGTVGYRYQIPGASTGTGICSNASSTQPFVWQISTEKKKNWERARKGEEERCNVSKWPRKQPFPGELIGQKVMSAVWVIPSRPVRTTWPSQSSQSTY